MSDFTNAANRIQYREHISPLENIPSLPLKKKKDRTNFLNCLQDFLNYLALLMNSANGIHDIYYFFFYKILFLCVTHCVCLSQLCTCYRFLQSMLIPGLNFLQITFVVISNLDFSLIKTCFFFVFFCIEIKQPKAETLHPRIILILYLSTYSFRGCFPHSSASSNHLWFSDGSISRGCDLSVALHLPGWILMTHWTVILALASWCLKMVLHAGKIFYWKLPHEKWKRHLPPRWMEQHHVLHALSQFRTTLPPLNSPTWMMMRW